MGNEGMGMPEMRACNEAEVMDALTLLAWLYMLSVPVLWILTWLAVREHSPVWAAVALVLLGVIGAVLWYGVLVCPVCLPCE